MREIKFRAWDSDKKEMVYPKIQFDESYVMQLNCSYIGEFNGKTYNTVKMPLMQFTGLTDLTGRDIYESDIIDIVDHNGLNRVEQVLFQSLCFTINGHTQSLSVFKNIGWEMEIIGNIYENPDLLK